MFSSITTTPIYQTKQHDDHQQQRNLMTLTKTEIEHRLPLTQIIISPTQLPLRPVAQRVVRNKLQCNSNEQVCQAFLPFPPQQQIFIATKTRQCVLHPGTTQPLECYPFWNTSLHSSFSLYHSSKMVPATELCRIRW